MVWMPFVGLGRSQPFIHFVLIIFSTFIYGIHSVKDVLCASKTLSFARKDLC